MARYIVTLKNSVDLRPLQNRREEVVGHMKEAHFWNNETIRNELDRWPGLTVENDFWANDSILVNIENPRHAHILEQLEWVDSVTPEGLNNLLWTEGTQVEEATDSLAWGIDDINAEQVWNEFGIDGSGVRVGVTDTGILPTHESLSGRLVTVDSNDPYYPGGWIQFDEGGYLVDNTPFDDNNHGTHVSGTIAGNNASGLSIGVAPGSELVVAKIFTAAGYAYDPQTVAGLQWMLEPETYSGATTGTSPRIINASWGADRSNPPYKPLLSTLEAAGIFFASSIGNDGRGTSGAPGHFQNVFGVGALRQADEFSYTEAADFSGGRIISSSQVPHPSKNYFRKPDISGPGQDVYSSVAYGDSSYGSFNGTSMSCPHICGVAALMLEADPNLTPQQIRDIIEATSSWNDVYSDDPFKDDRYGAGRVNAYEAVKAVL